MGFTYTVFTIYNEIESQTKLSHTFTDDWEADTFKIYIQTAAQMTYCMFGETSSGKDPFHERTLGNSRQWLGIQKQSNGILVTGYQQAESSRASSFGDLPQYELRKQQGYQGKGSFFSMEGQRRYLTYV